MQTPNLSAGKWIISKRVVFTAIILIVLSTLYTISSQVGRLPHASAAGDPVVIDFEDLSASGPGTGATVVVTNQYADKGITFNSPVALDYSKGIAIPGFTHSGTKAIEQCYGQEFCTTPIQMNFTTAQTRVKVWVGYSSRLNENRIVVLRSFDVGGAQVGQVTTTFAPSSQPIPIQTPLEVTSHSANIIRATVSFSSGTIFTNNLAVDDVEFSAVGPPPPCTTTQNPVVTIFQPANGLNRQINEFILQGSISTNAPLDAATITTTTSGGSNTINLLSSGLVSPNGGSFGPVRIDGLLLSGFKSITVIAHNCRGSGQSSVGITFTPIATGTRFVFMGMEVTQAIQNLNNSVSLIAGKRTFVRIFLVVEGPTTEIRDVSGALSVCNDTSGSASACFPGRPGTRFPILQSLNTITVNSSTDITAKRRGDSNGVPVYSLNFEIPPQWLTSNGQFHFQISYLNIEGIRSSLPCQNCDNLNEFGFPVFVRFVQAPPVRLHIVGFSYTVNGTSYRPRTIDISLLLSWLRRAYPTATVLSPQMTLFLGRGFDHLPSCKEVNTTLFWMAVSSNNFGLDTRTHHYGLIADGGGFMRGCAIDTPSVIASGPTGVPGNSRFTGSGWDGDASYGDWYGGHELGHTYGRNHPGFSTCSSSKQDREDKNYPYPGGLISGPDQSEFGFDVGDAIGIPQQVYPPNVWSDVMTYNCNQWISAYTYQGILDNLSTLERQQSNLLATNPDTLLVVGTINLTKGTVQLLPFSRLPDLQLTPRPAKSSFSIDLLDSKGKVLASYLFEPKQDTEASANEDQAASLAEVVSYVQGTARIVISRNGKVLASRTVSPRAPQVKVNSPNGGEILHGQVTVRWNAKDADGDKLTYSVLYSSDAGKTWQTIGVNIKTSSFTVNLDELPGGDQSLFRVIATDGVNTGKDESVHTFNVSTKAPQVNIISPSDKSSSTTRQTIVFNGEATDLEDGSLDGKALRWVSDKQGTLGFGRSISVSGLTPGLHTITLEAKDKSGKVGRASIRVTIVPIAPVADAGQDRTVTAGNVVNLDGSNSQGFGKLTYQWQIVAKPKGSQAVLSSTTTAQTKFVADLTGEYVIQLLVKDATGETAIDRITIKAN